MWSAIFIALSILSTVSTEAIHPLYVWPLGNNSLNYDVIGGKDMSFQQDDKCYAFSDGPPGLPYSVLDLGEGSDSFIDATLNGKTLLKDITISFYVNPGNDDVSGTLLHYQQDDREIMRVRTLANTFLVSFRDEYGMSAGMMYLVNFLNWGEWSHVIVSRDFETGRITVFKDGVQMYSKDDEFSDIISFSHTGKLRLGKSLEAEDADVFVGNFACLQLYDRVIGNEGIENLKSMCLPENWNRKPAVYYEDHGGLFCIAAAPLPEPDITGIVSRTLVSRDSYFRAFLKKHGLRDSKKDQSYFKLESPDFRPITNDDLICHVNATDVKVCSQLCMRVDGCISFLLETIFEDESFPCSLYSKVVTDLTESPGSKYYFVEHFSN